MLKRLSILLLTLALLVGCSGAVPSDSATTYEPYVNNALDAPTNEPMADIPPVTTPDEPEIEPVDDTPGEPENRIPTLEEQIPFLESSILFVMPQANCDL